MKVRLLPGPAFSVGFTYAFFFSKGEMTNLKTVWGRYVCAERDSTHVIADREAAGEWEEFTIEPQEQGIVAFKTAHGTYLCCHPDGTLVHRHPNYTPGDPPGSWEKFRVVMHSINRASFQTAFDTYLVAETPENQSLKPYTIRHRHPNDTPGAEPGSWETFEGDFGSPVVISHPDPIQGTARLSNGGRSGTADDTGNRLLWGVHAGDLLSRLLNHGSDDVDRYLQSISSAGAHYVRTWSYLWGNWWATAPRPGQCHPGQPGYWQAVRDYAQLCRKHKLQWLVSQGDLFRDPSSINAKQNFMVELASLLKEEGGLELVIGVDAGNENASAGNPDAETMARVLDPFLAVLRPAFISTTSNDENDLNRYVSRVCSVVDSHHGRWHYRMAIERAWAAGYWDGKFRPYLMSSEPVGVGCQEYSGDIRVGHHISATANPRDWDDIESMSVLAAAHFVSRQGYVYMSSPGVISDEPFSNYPALEQTGWLARRLPRDIQTYRIFHGGDNRSFSGDRVLGVPVDDAARCEHSVSGSTYVVLVHGEAKTHNCRGINGFEGVRIDLTTREETPVSWRAGQTVPVTFRRGCLFIGTRV